MAKQLRGSGEGGWIWNTYFKFLAGPASVQGAIQGFTQEAHDGWKRDLENRKLWSAGERERKRAAIALRRS